MSGYSQVVNSKEDKAYFLFILKTPFRVLQEVVDKLESIFYSPYHSEQDF